MIFPDLPLHRMQEVGMPVQEADHVRDRQRHPSLSHFMHQFLPECKVCFIIYGQPDIIPLINNGGRIFPGNIKFTQGN